MTYDLALITEPSGDVITLEEAKAQILYQGTAQDAHIQALIDTAVGLLDGVKGMLNRSLLTQTWRLTVDGFWEGGMRMPLGDVQSVSSVKYDDENGVEQTLDPARYTFQGQHGHHYLCRITTQGWPGVSCEPGAVRIEYVTGYGAAADIPAPIKQLVKYMVSEMYRHRGATVDYDPRKDMLVCSIVSQFGLMDYGSV